MAISKNDIMGLYNRVNTIIVASRRNQEDGGAFKSLTFTQSFIDEVADGRRHAECVRATKEELARARYLYERAQNKILFIDPNDLEKGKRLYNSFINDYANIVKRNSAWAEAKFDEYLASLGND